MQEVVVVGRVRQPPNLHQWQDWLGRSIVAHFNAMKAFPVVLWEILHSASLHVCGSCHGILLAINAVVILSAAVGFVAIIAVLDSVHAYDGIVCKFASMLSHGLD